MKRELKKLLFDIQEAGLAVKRFIHGKSQSDYEASDLLRSAVERKFEIIGEALNRMRQIDEESVEQISEYRKIIGFRNILAHGYDAISDEIVWEICGASLDMLLNDVEQLLNQ
ncbi:MAG: HepT-like ribonuclease domain-containing protein [Caldilineaceae bacterium]